tara:strand:+ start:1846 stop:1992 length:147 start_codon:yes stop_codon:yes gene_type:complete
LKSEDEIASSVCDAPALFQLDEWLIRHGEGVDGKQVLLALPAMPGAGI